MIKTILIASLCLYLAACDETSSPSIAAALNSPNSPSDGETPLPQPIVDSRMSDIAGQYMDASGKYGFEVLQDGKFTASVPGVKCTTDYRYNPALTTCTQQTYALDGALAFREVPGATIPQITVTLSSLGQTQTIDSSDSQRYYSGGGAFTSRWFNETQNINSGIVQTSPGCYRILNLAAVLENPTNYVEIAFCMVTP